MRQPILIPNPQLPNACQSQVRCVDRARSARPVLPAPSALPATTDAHRRLDEIRRTATGRYFLRNRRNNCHQTAAAAVVVPNNVSAVRIFGTVFSDKVPFYLLYAFREIGFCFLPFRSAIWIFS